MINPGTPEQFSIVRQYLRDRYTDSIVAAALGVPTLGAFTERAPGNQLRDPLVRLFFAGAVVQLPEVRSVMPAPVLDAFGALGILRFADEQNRYLWCTVVLYPLGDLFLISDRVMLPDGTPVNDQEFVYFALTPNTQRFLRTLPQLPCGSFLDVGSGCGAAALAQSAYAGVSVASDVSPRSSLYAEFNRRLNGIGNVEVVQASVYDGVAGRQFDRIGCHPPYDISASVQWTFAAGGDDGETVIRSVVQGLPEHLAPGGEFITLFRAADCKGAPLEQRLRSWLGERNAEFDVVLVVGETSTVQEHVWNAVVSASAEMDVYRSWMTLFAERGVEQMVYGSVLIRRKLFGSPPVTVRRMAGRRCEYAELRWALDWEQTTSAVDLESAVLRVSPDVEIVVRHRIQNGEMHATGYTLVASSPFRDEVPCSHWLAQLISEFDGRRTGLEVFGKMRQSGTVEARQFEAAVQRLIAIGVLQNASGGQVRA